MWFNQHNEQLRDFQDVASILTWYYHGFKDGGDVRAISLDGSKNAVVLVGALKTIPRSGGRHSSR